jgi:transcriptional regulator with GAF, ATPase, and Fis domain
VPSRNVLIAATQHTLRKTVAEGRFRDALFYRLNVFPITVPPLRARADDLPLLVRHFVTQNGWARRSTACRRKRSLLLRFMRGAAPVTLKDAERLRISRALREVNGVIAALAAPAVQLGLPPSTPFYKMRRLGISASGREQHARSESLSVL